MHRILWFCGLQGSIRILPVRVGAESKQKNTTNKSKRICFSHPGTLLYSLHFTDFFLINYVKSKFVSLPQKLSNQQGNARQPQLKLKEFQLGAKKLDILDHTGPGQEMHESSGAAGIS
jgi:hypothetical protein